MDTKIDTLGLKVGLDRISQELLSHTRKPTKRKYLRIMMSVHNPLVILCPFTLKLKLILQKKWRSKIGWDDEIRDKEN